MFSFTKPTVYINTNRKDEKQKSRMRLGLAESPSHTNSNYYLNSSDLHIGRIHKSFTSSHLVSHPTTVVVHPFCSPAFSPPPNHHQRRARRDGSSSHCPNAMALLQCGSSMHLEPGSEERQPCRACSPLSLLGHAALTLARVTCGKGAKDAGGGLEIVGSLLGLGHFSACYLPSV